MQPSMTTLFEKRMSHTLVDTSGILTCGGLQGSSKKEEGKNVGSEFHFDSSVCNFFFTRYEFVSTSTWIVAVSS